MKHNFSLAFNFSRVVKSLVFALGIGILAFSCTEDDGSITPMPIDNESVTSQLSSQAVGGVITLETSKLIVPPNAIPDLVNGSEAIVTFTIEKGAELPKTLPTGMDAVGPITHFGPEGFVFKEALWLQFELPEGLAVDQVSIVGYLPDTRDYGILPITYYDEENRVIGTSVYELGYYFLVNIEGLNRARGDKASGGFRLRNFHGNDWYPNPVGLGSWSSFDTYFKVIIVNFVPDDPSDFALWAPYNPNTNGGRAYWEFATPPNTTGWKPNHNLGITAMGIPQGTYTAQIVASHKYLQSDVPECQTYSLPTTFRIDGSLTCSFSGCEGYDVGPALPANGVWTPTDCSGYNPKFTVPVCTGEFQATLTWFNGENGDTDLDLHLRGPDGLEVSYANSNPGVGGIILDRDVISTPGPVQENICAPTLSGMPAGNYEVFVVHYDGEPKSYQVRVLIGNNSSSYQGEISPGAAEQVIHSFSL